MRVVSLLPACTEIVCALGMERLLVGRSHECDFPESIQRLPVVTRARVDSKASSAIIDRQVKETLNAGLSLYEIDAALLARLKPDLILTQTQCEACAVTPREIEVALLNATGLSPRILSLAPTRLPEVWDSMRQIAIALEMPDAGREIIRAFKTRVADLIVRVCQLNARPIVACIEWTDPLMVAGNWVPEMVELSGGVDRLGRAGNHSPFLDVAQVQKANPGILIFMPCGFSLGRTMHEASELIQTDEWKQLRAVREGQVYAVDGNQYFNRPGPRLVDSIEILCEILHPERFRFGHEGRAWKHVEA